MYQPFHKLRVRFAELEMKQGEVAKRANMAESTLTARMTGRLPWKGGAGHPHRPDRHVLL